MEIDRNDEDDPLAINENQNEKGDILPGHDILEEELEIHDPTGRLVDKELLPN